MMMPQEMQKALAKQARTLRLQLNLSQQIMGEGKNTIKKHLLKLASVGNISKDKALDIINHVSAATEKWYEFANEVGVSKKQTKNIGCVLDLIRKSFDC